MTFKYLLAFSSLLFLNLAQAQNVPVESGKATNYSPPPPAPTTSNQASATVANQERELNAAEKAPEYPGGLHAFRMKIANIFNTENVKGTGRVSAEATFIIEKDGQMSTIKVTGNNEAMNAECTRLLHALAEKTPWEPAEYNGTPVRYRMRLPITMVLD